MDPLSITAAAWSFLDAGIRLKASIDKVGANRRRLRELTDDLVLVLTSVKNFCDEHETTLREAPFAELNSSMTQVTCTLVQLCSQAERVADAHKKMKIIKPHTVLAAWRDASNLEAQLQRLREKIQISLNQAQLLISARTEVVLTTLEQEVLVSRADAQAHVRQLDDLFCESLCAPDSKYSTLSFLDVSELDNITLPYIRLKLRNIQRLWAGQSQIITIAPGTYSSVMPETYMRQPHFRDALPFTTIVKRLAEIWQIISIAHVGSASSFDAACIMDVVDDLRGHGLMDITFDLFNCFISDLRHAICASDTRRLTDELCLWLSFAFRRQSQASFSSSNFSSTAFFVQEALKTFLTL